MKVNHNYFLLKCAPLVAIFATLPFWQAALVSLFLTWAYQYVVALICGAVAMPTMDNLCFLGDSTAIPNFMSVTTIEPFAFDKAR